MPLDNFDLQSIKTTISQAPFMTMESNLQDTFDHATPTQLAQAIEFFKATPLSNCVFETGSGDTFTIRNSANNTSIDVSNRTLSSMNEMRADHLRTTIREYQRNHPKATLYDVFEEHRKNATFGPLKNILTGNIQGLEKKFSPEQFDLIVETLSTIFAKAMPGIIDTHFAGKTPSLNDFIQKQNDLKEQRQELWAGIEVQAICDRVLSIPESFTASLAQFQQKQEQLSRRGFEQSSAAMKTLREGLLEEQKKYCLENIDRKSFFKNCTRHLDNAQNSALRSHRGFLGSLALHRLTFGLSSKAPTDSIKKIAQIKSILQNFVQEGSDPKPMSPADDSSRIKPK